MGSLTKLQIEQEAGILTNRPEGTPPPSGIHTIRPRHLAKVTGANTMCSMLPLLGMSPPPHSEYPLQRALERQGRRMISLACSCLWIFGGIIS